MFLANRESANCRRQIMCRQIMTFLFLANRTSANCYAPEFHTRLVLAKFIQVSEKGLIFVYHNP